MSHIILTNAAVYTSDAKGTTADTVVIENGRIAYVGTAEGAEPFRTADARVIDGGGRTLLPGLVDSHMHPLYAALLYDFEVNLRGGSTLPEYEAVIRDFVAAHPELDIYCGGGFMRPAFDAVGPRKETLDAICPDKPILIQSMDCHSYWVNSKALELAGITRDTPDPIGGIIQRDPDTGEPSGQLLETAADPIAGLKPVYTREQYKEAIRWLQGWLHQRGITTIYDAQVPLQNEDHYMAFQELAEAGELTIRVRGAWWLSPEMGSEGELMALVERGIALSGTFTTDCFQINSFKFFADQVVEEETAYLNEPYCTRDDGWRGIRVWDDDLLAALFAKVDAAGFRIHVHQMGDAAASYALDALEKARQANGERDSRHTFAHIQLISERDKQRMADLHMNALIAPYWFVMEDYFWHLSVPSLGRERAERMYPAKSLMDFGLNVAVHSDFEVTEPELGWLLSSATTRTLPPRLFKAWYGDRGLTRTTDTTVEASYELIGPLPPHEERLTREETVKAATYNGAYANFMENEIGSIEVGKKADLVLLDMNIFEEDIETVAGAKPVMTIFDGEIVYEK